MKLKTSLTMLLSTSIALAGCAEDTGLGLIGDLINLVIGI